MEQELVFGQSSAQRTRAAIAGALLLGFFGAFVPIVLLRMVLNVPGADAKALAWTIPAAVAGALLGLILGISNGGKTVVVTPYEVRIMSGSKVWRSFDRRTHWFNSKITVHRTNGVQSGVSRELVVTNEAGQATFAVPLDRAKFSMLMNTLNPPTQLVGDLSPELLNSVPPTITYQLNTKLPKSAARTQFIVTIIFTVMLMAIPAIVLLADEDLTSVGLYMGLGMLALCAPFLIWTYLRANKLIKRIPSTITVDASGISLDNARYDYNLLTGISLTPAEYTINQFEIGLQGQEKLFVVPLGPSAKKYKTFPDYDAFTKHLIHATANRPGLVSFQLG